MSGTICLCMASPFRRRVTRRVTRQGTSLAHAAEERTRTLGLGAREDVPLQRGTARGQAALPLCCTAQNVPHGGDRHLLHDAGRPESVEQDEGERAVAHLLVVR